MYSSPISLIALYQHKLWPFLGNFIYLFFYFFFWGGGGAPVRGSLKHFLTLACWVILHAFLSSVDFLFN